VPGRTVLVLLAARLAMQKVEGSNPFSRFFEAPGEAFERFVSAQVALALGRAAAEWHNSPGSAVHCSVEAGG
jgi:hypothetical protein